MMAALAVFGQVGKIADADFLAMDVLPILWSFSLGPLLNLQQFEEFMTLIKSISSKVEQEQTRKLRDLSSSSAHGLPNSSRANDLTSIGSTAAMFGPNGTEAVGESDFERLVLGRGGASTATNNDMLGESLRPQTQRAQSAQAQTPVFSWSTPTMSRTPSSAIASTQFANPSSRAITPDQTLSSFATLNPTPAAAAPLSSQPTINGLNPFAPMQPTAPSISSWGIMSATAQPRPSYPTPQSQSNFSVAPPPQNTSSFPPFSIAPPPSQNQRINPSTQYVGGQRLQSNANQSSTKPIQPPPKKGLDAYESLI